MKRTVVNGAEPLAHALNVSSGVVKVDTSWAIYEPWQSQQSDGCTYLVLLRVFSWLTLMTPRSVGLSLAAS